MFLLYTMLWCKCWCKITLYTWKAVYLMYFFFFLEWKIFTILFTSKKNSMYQILFVFFLFIFFLHVTYRYTVPTKIEINICLLPSLFVWRYRLSILCVLLNWMLLLFRPIVLPFPTPLYLFYAKFMSISAKRSLEKNWLQKWNLLA